MGGFISAEFILQSEIADFKVVNNFATIELFDSEWKILNHQRGSIKISGKTSNTEAGRLLSITGSINLKSFDQNLNILRTNKYIILRCQTTNGEYRIFGTKEYPLQITLSPLTPEKTSGFAGYELEINGKQEFESPFTII